MYEYVLLLLLVSGYGALPWVARVLGIVQTKFLGTDQLGVSGRRMSWFR